MSIVDLIDTAIRDWDVGGDAMRWTPDSRPADADDVPQWERDLLIAEHRRRHVDPPYAPGSAELTAIMPSICRWLTANGFIPARVPLHAVPVVATRWVWCEVHLYGPNGRLVWDKAAGEVRTVVQRRRLRVEPPDELWPWLYTGDVEDTLWPWVVRRNRLQAMRAGYARRLQARRRRSR